MKLTKLFLQVLVLSLLTRVSLAEENRFVSFVNNPASSQYDAIVAYLKTQKADKEWERFQRNYKEWAKFIRLVENSNTIAVDLANKLAPKTDGGNLEDLCRAVGMNVQPCPELVLRALQNNRASESRQSCMLTMLPKSTVDNIDAKLVELEARMAAISSVNNPDLLGYKEKAMMILDNEIYSLRGMRGDIPFLRKK